MFKTTTHKKYVSTFLLHKYLKNNIWNNSRWNFKISAHDIHFDTCPSYFKLSITKSNRWAMTWFTIKKNMLVELCVGNYIISNDLVNSANKPFENYKRSFPKLLTWINFHNLQIRINTRIKTCMCMKTSWHLTKKLSPTELKIVSY